VFVERQEWGIDIPRSRDIDDIKVAKDGVILAEDAKAPSYLLKI
jgi:hypothetical protein